MENQFFALNCGTGLQKCENYTKAWSLVPIDVLKMYLMKVLKTIFPNVYKILYKDGNNNNKKTLMLLQKHANMHHQVISGTE